jgi:eukaryotic-like serine/threonine-protein kinase
MENLVIAGRYRLIRPLGEGAMGAVWLAQHLALDAPVVIKLIRSELAARADVRARFTREARIAARMRSAHVVGVLDHGVTEAGDPFLVMEHLEGETLRERLIARWALPPAETAEIITQICRGVSKAHEAQLVHRDLKPDNVFLARDVGAEIVKVLDFGVVKVPDALALDGVAPTVTGTLVGTPSYMSPEQAQGLRTVDYRSDLWSLGVIAYECLTSLLPFPARTLGQLTRQITLDPIPPPSSTPRGATLPPGLDAWMRRALARDPAHRFESALDLAVELHHAIDR